MCQMTCHTTIAGQSITQIRDIEYIIIKVSPCPLISKTELIKKYLFLKLIYKISRHIPKIIKGGYVGIIDAENSINLYFESRDVEPVDTIVTIDNRHFIFVNNLQVFEDMEKTDTSKSSLVERKNLKSWKEINKTRKEERRKWREEKLKKIQAEVKTQQNEHVEEKQKPVTKNISTISIAVPGSILDNAQSDELRTYLAGQIARAAAIFQIDEIIVYDDLPKGEIKKDVLNIGDEIKTSRRCCVQLARILQYLECPQYLRKHFFPIHKDLRFVGVLNPIDTPHHLRQNNNFQFREGVVTTKPPKTNRGSQVYVGLSKDVEVDKLLTPGLRCTVKILNADDPTKKLKGLVVSPRAPHQETGVYWGYTVRLAESISHIFSECPYKNGYDLLLGTSDKGKSIDECSSFVYDHLLVMFGGLAGLEAAFESDELLKVNDPTLLFDYYLNTLPNQGSRTVRTEEAILVSLAALRPKLNPKCKAPTFKDTSIEQEDNQMQEYSSD